MTITDALCLKSLRWMRDNDYSLRDGAGFLALRLGITDGQAQMIIDAGREIELRKQQRGVKTEVSKHEAIRV